MSASSTALRMTGRDPATGRPLLVHTEGGRIAAIEPGPEDEECWIAPGLIDLQVNGYGGHDLNGTPTPDTVVELAHALFDSGVTTFVPTLITADEDSLIGRLRAIAAARRMKPSVKAAIPFVHVEGPWISPLDGPRGAHPREHVCPPDLGAFARWQAACGGLIGMVTLAPEHWGAEEAIRALAAQGVRVAIGHSDASPAEVEAAAAAGATLSTHLGNGIAATLPRHPNPIWSQLADDRLTACFIADGDHLAAPVLRAMLRAKGLDRAVLVSDLVALGGMPPGEYEQPVGGQVELHPDGRLTLRGTPYLAGAALPLDAGVAFAVSKVGLTLAEALQLATRNPGRFVGGRGVFRVGEPADLLRFAFAPGDAGLRVRGVLQSRAEAVRSAR